MHTGRRALGSRIATVLLTASMLCLLSVPLLGGSTASAQNGPLGYWLVASDGGVFSCGGATFYGSAGDIALNRPVVGMAATPDGHGYWLVASDGGIFTYGDAGFFGSAGAIPLNRPIVGMAATPDGRGYWLVASDGGIFTYGDAGFYGSTGAMVLNRPIVGMAATPDGHGYWLVASDGGIFTFGDAAFHGSTGSLVLNRPIVGMASTLSGHGYWLVASDGGIFTFGDAPFYGSTGSLVLNRPVVGMSATPDGGGYWLVASDGGIFTFGDAPFRGSTGFMALNRPVVGMASAPGGDMSTCGTPFPSGSTGYDISWPQCGPPVSLPPPAPVAIVGADGGSAFQHNRCLAAEWPWAGPGGNLYMNINWDGVSGSPGPAYNYGFAAQDAVGYAASQGASAKVWWIDVETANTWSANQSVNAATIQGAINGLRASGVTPGVYGTYYQWNLITGGYQAGVPQWVAGAGSLPETVPWCVPGAHTGNGDPVSFDGGPVWLIQYGYFNVPPHPFDEDYAC
jgi:hypothetical protein